MYTYIYIYNIYIYIYNIYIYIYNIDWIYIFRNTIFGANLFFLKIMCACE